MSTLLLREEAEAYTPQGESAPDLDASCSQGQDPTSGGLREEELTAAWLLGLLPGVLVAPWRVVRAGRAGRGPGPDVRAASFALPTGVVLAGDVEVHLRASDFARHGHAHDPAYSGVVLHLVWRDDREDAGTPLVLPGGGQARVVEVAPLLGGAVERLLAPGRHGPSGSEPCAGGGNDGRSRAELRRAGERRLAERTWRAAALVAERGWDEAWRVLLDEALAKCAGRRAESAEARGEAAERITSALGAEPLEALAGLARGGDPRVLIEALRAGVLGAGRAAEVGWNAALPLLGALAAAYGDTGLARGTAALVASWPAPRPYGRTRTLSALLGVTPRRAVEAQGLLHVQELWCERGGCGVCPFSDGTSAAPEGFA